MGEVAIGIVYLAAMEMPRELVEAFDGDAKLMEWLCGLSPSLQKAIADWVVEPKGAEARERRAAQMAERLLATMEGERELPPVLARALKGKALVGWEASTLVQRREHLLMVFGAQSVETQERRVGRVVEACLERAGKVKSV